MLTDIVALDRGDVMGLKLFNSHILDVLLLEYSLHHTKCHLLSIIQVSNLSRSFYLLNFLDETSILA